MNHVGRTAAITAPSAEAQKNVILDAWERSGVNPETITYVEAHGTGTSLGDPIEVEALTRAFREYTDACQFCGIGSVKSNIGHLEGAAGIAGMIKVLLMMAHQKIPPTLNIRTFNPIINFSDSPFIPVTEAIAWTGVNHPRALRAGISAFGFGGANAHAIVESFANNGPDALEKEPEKAKRHPFMITAKSVEALEIPWLAGANSLAAINRNDFH